MNQETWIKDGTTATAPVTDTTPAPVETPPVAVAATPANAPASAADAAAQATAAGATPAEAAKAAQEFIEGRVGDAPFQIPKNLQIPWKRGNETGFESIEDVQRRGMFERDYRIKTSEVATQRRQLEQQQRVLTARIGAQEQWNTEQAEQAARAYATPEDQAQYEQFLDAYRTNPQFKQMVDDAREARIMGAERAAIQELHTSEALQAEAQAVASAIEHIGTKYPGVDPNLIRERYARALQLDELPLSEQAIEHLYKQEAQAASRYTAPLHSELEALKATVASLQSGQAAAAHNDKTRQSIERTKNPVGAPAGGNAPAPAAPSTTLKGSTMQERSREWAKLR
jgi:hypothetical protein